MTIPRLLPLLWMLLAAAAVSVRAAEEYELKAALVLNIARFTRWPPEAFASSPDTITLCLVEEGVLFQPFESLAGKSVGERRLVVKTAQPIDRLDQCHILFVSGYSKSLLPRIFAAVSGRPVLTIGETPGFVEFGGIVNLIRQDNRVRFEINLEAARSAGIAISSRLLKLAILKPVPNKTP
ncbi:hypothetical protein MIN45_P2020 [Methylomarinovum tepidoasis]|uniref:Transmembrane protein n=1 Tax=Methylomarinovum tepidoasis TaxID=2840183 RepID=A0AAU9CPQ7_9GAMM|nr:YfiR family protein [Methylomarinovum sp. IN45]BCX89647.1 hypothetical protein MIN45_P2020 [Methylomarinovum sp. IN45]